MTRALILSAACIATVAAPEGPTQAALVVVELALEPVDPVEGRPGLAGTLTIRNAGRAGASVEHPDNRMAVTFFVTNALGNVIEPTFRGKSDPPSRQVGLEPGSAFRHTFDRLDFVTGSAWCGYDLKSGETYRVVAIYRPEGAAGPGVASKEVVVTIR